MSQLITNTELLNTQIGKSIIVVSQCENCKRFKKHTPWPVVGGSCQSHRIQSNHIC